MWGKLLIMVPKVVGVLGSAGWLWPGKGVGDYCFKSRCQLRHCSVWFSDAVVGGSFCFHRPGAETQLRSGCCL